MILLGCRPSFSGSADQRGPWHAATYAAMSTHGQHGIRHATDLAIDHLRLFIRLVDTLTYTQSLQSYS